jgi:hypothetical protein
VDDSVLFMPTRQVGACALGDVSTARVVAVSGNNVAIRLATVAHSHVPTLFVNGSAVSALSGSGIAIARMPRTKVPEHDVFLLAKGGTGACDSRALGPVPTSSLLGFTQAGMEARLGVVQRQLDDRITAEKYVAGVYLLFVAFFMLYLLIHATRFSRLQREVASLTSDLRTADET